jgi:class 3 adenylate cyclase/tetratricopeptide (TPR) repeat protein
LCIILIVPYHVFSQTARIDSLRSLAHSLSSKPDTHYVNALNTLAYSLRGKASEEGMKIARTALRLSDSLRFQRGKALALLTIGWCHFGQSRYAQAMEAYLEGEKAAELGEHTTELAQIVQYKAILFRVLDNPERALAEHLRADTLMRSVTISDSTNLMDLWEDIGIDYRYINRPDIAQVYLLRALAFFRKTNDSVNLAITKHNLGECYYAENRIDEALREFEATDTIARRIGYMRILAFKGIALGKLYNRIGKPFLAIQHIQEAIALAEAKRERHQLKEAYRVLAQTYSSLGNVEQANAFTLRFAALQDSIYRENVRQNFALQQTNIAAERREAELQRLLQEETARKRFTIILSIGIGLLLIGIGLLAWLVISERRAKAEIVRQQDLLHEQAVEIQLVNTGLQEQNLELERSREHIASMNAVLAERNTALEESYGSIRILSEIGKKITSTLDIYSIGMTLYDDINKLLETPIMVVGTYLPEEQVIEYTLTIESGRRLGELRLPMTETDRPAVQCVLQRKPVVVQEFQQTALHGDTPQSLVYVPLINPNDEIIGVFSVQSYKKHYFTEQHLNILGTIVPFITSALTNANAYRELDAERKIAQRERLTSETLLLNILPQPIAHRLKSGERAIADKFDSVTVLFADIVGFTKISARTSPEELVSGLGSVFAEFDALAHKYHLEKIKTIGDAYMIAGGLPERSLDHCERVAMFALEMLEIMQKNLFQMAGSERISLRIGIHLGSAVAGVIGSSKFAYDIWGDTVNTASRMESHGEAGKIHVSEEVFTALTAKHETKPNRTFTFEERGKIEVKGKGLMRTYFLTGWSNV